MQIKIVFRWITILLLALVVSGCKEGDPAGPGMTATYRTLDWANQIWVNEIRYPSGKTRNGWSFVYDGDKTEGFTPDNRQIPRWIEFTWIEPGYYHDENQAPPQDERMTAIDKLTPKTQRVEVGSRIPPDVIAQAVEAVKNRKKSQLPEKFIWIYFTWKAGKIYFRWELNGMQETGPSKVLLSGGDPDPE